MTTDDRRTGDSI